MTATHIFVIEKTKECNRYKNINQSQIGYLDDGTIGNICRFQRFFPIKNPPKQEMKNSKTKRIGTTDNSYYFFNFHFLI